MRTRTHTHTGKGTPTANWLWGSNTHITESIQPFSAKLWRGQLVSHLTRFLELRGKMCRISHLSVPCSLITHSLPLYTSPSSHTHSLPLSYPLIYLSPSPLPHHTHSLPPHLTWKDQQDLCHEATICREHVIGMTFDVLLLEEG